MSDKKQLSGWKKFLQSMTKAHDLGSEEEILTDHDYDGIKELDNVLPPWWKYGFYITIVVAVFYLLKFEVWHTGMNPTEEYNTEMTTAKIETEAYLASAKENVDENSFEKDLQKLRSTADRRILQTILN